MSPEKRYLMGHGYRPIVCKIRILNPNQKSTKIRNANMLRYIATREGVDLTKVSSFESALHENIDLTDKGEELALEAAPDEEYLKYMSYRPRSHGLFGNINTDDFADVAKQLTQASNDKKVIYRITISLSEVDGNALGYTNSEKWNLYLKSVMPDIASTLGVSQNNMIWVAAFHAEQTHPHVHVMMWDKRDKVRNPFVTIRQQNECREICQNAMFTEENEALIRSITKAEREEIEHQKDSYRKNVTDYLTGVFQDPKTIPGITTEILPGRVGTEEHIKLNGLYKKVLETMPGRGRIMYAFMPPECKAYIDQITDTLMKRSDLGKQYRQYLSATKALYKIEGYTKEEIDQKCNKIISDIYARSGNIILKGIKNTKAELLNEAAERYESLMQKEEVSQPVNENSNEQFLLADSEADLEELEEERGKRVEQDTNVLQDQDLKNMLDEKSTSYDPIKAESILRELLSKDNDICLHFILGKLYADQTLDLFDQQKAVKHLEIFRAQNENHYETNVLLGKLYSDKDFSDFNYRKAVDFYEKAVHLNLKKSNYIKLRLSRIYADKEQELFDYEKALTVLNDASDQVGSVSLQKGNIYMSMEEEERAVAYYELSVQKNNPYAAYQLGKIQCNPVNQFYNQEEGTKNLKIAFDSQKMPRAGVLLAQAYIDCGQLSTAEKTLRELIKQLETKESKRFHRLSNYDKEMKSNAYLQLGKIYFAEGELQSSDKAKECYQKCLEILENVKGDASGRIALQKSSILMDEQNPLQNMEKGVEYLREAAVKGNTIAQYRLGKILLEEENGDARREGVNFLKKAAEKNFGYAYVKLGMIYADKSADIYDPRTALRYFQQAEECGVRDDMGIIAFKTGMIYLDPNTDFFDRHQGLLALEQAALCNNVSAIVKQGMIYADRYSDIYNPDRALSMLKRAYALDVQDNKGIVALKMGSMYADENCSEYNMQEAIRYYIKSAECKNTTAMTRLFKCFHYGLGIEKDEKLAQYWLNQAIKYQDTYAKDYADKLDRQEKAFFRSCSYALLRQIFLSMQQTKEKREIQLKDREFRTVSKQVKKEEHLHKE